MHSNNNNTMRFGSKAFILTAAIIIIVGCTISGTVAWMFVKADPAVNTFAYGDIKIEITETDTKDDDDDKTNSYSFTPKAVIAKDPLVTVKAGHEACWLFVEVVESGNFDDYMEYRIADGWMPLDNESGVYYRKVAASDTDQKFTVLKDNVVKVKSSVTQADLDALTAENYPTLQFEAYSVQQQEVDDAKTAWSIVK